MMDRTTKHSLRRKLKRHKKRVAVFGEQAEQHFDRHIFRRMNNLPGVRRFMASWLALLILLAGSVVVQARALSKYYQVDGPAEGGIYTEGVLGVFTNANPIYATATVDASVSKLLFSGLFAFNEKGALVGDLADSIEVDETGRRYTVRLKQGIRWHDGNRLTSDDVVFTYKTIQNADAKSPLNASWQGIEVAASDEYTVTFQLPNRLTSFPFSLTNGIIPQHLLQDVSPSQLRSASFNTLNPVGSGPFKWESVQVSGGDAESRVQQIALAPNETYHGGQPKLSRFAFKTYRSEDKLIESFENRELTAAVGLTQVTQVLAKDPAVTPHNLSSSSAVMLFLKTSDPLLAEVKLRKALAHATNQREVIVQLGYPAVAVDGPFLRGQIGYAKDVKQTPFNIAEANKLLDELGWIRGEGGLRHKDGKPLEISVTSQNNAEYRAVMSAIQRQWLAAGVKLKENFMNESDIQTTALPLHSYQALLYGISIGPDPDVFPYWHSSQIDVASQGRLNFSEYKSTVADEALEGGRTRTDPTLRTVKYRPFLEGWRDAVPAIALYQPRYLYLTRGPLFNFTAKNVHSSTDRYINVHNWMIRQEKVIQ